MSGTRLGTLAYGLRHLRRAPDITALRAAPSPDELARLALIPAGRNLGIAVGFLAPALRAEATAALLACRVLDAYEDLTDDTVASSAVLTAAEYLCGAGDTPPPPLPAVAARDSEAVDLVLAERIRDVRALLTALPSAGRERVGRMLVDIGGVMARNIDAPLPRVAYGEGVLGRVTYYACSLVADDAFTDADLRELTACVGVVAQSANDLRDGELTLYGVADRGELTRTVMLRLLTPALGGVALLARMGPNTKNRGARAAMAYMTITTAGFLCGAVGAPAPYRRPVGAAALATFSATYWTTMLERVRRAADVAIQKVLDTAPDLTAGAGPATEVLSSGDPRTMPSSMVPLIVDTTFALVRSLPDEPLTGKLPDPEVRAMMIADHLAFGALERLPAHQPDAMYALAKTLQLAALDTSTQGARP
ncbi:MAG: hypothetical protein JWN03_1761 [Nocardia sp.]|uniref:hypothetical protein n=1 Tax=Nocardia sp. TaxID=1821 RepID=UPI0026238D9B|nr:hypothetical protein [Nocardia sp.]MCU1641486.1 hypothetical protein [Nocardia sp.]